MEATAGTDQGTPPVTPPPAATPPAPAGVQPTATPATGTIPTQPVPQYQMPAAAPPPPPRPMSKFQSGIADIVGDMADALAGKTRQTVYRDAQTGERVVDQTPLTRKQQWGSIVARAISGAGAGAGVAPGPGNKLRALSAGIQTGEAQAQQQKQQQESLSDEDFKAKRDTMMQNANLALLGAKTTASAFELGQAKVKALQGTVENENSVNTLIQDSGGEDLGVVRNAADLVALTKNNPDLIKSHMNGGIYHALHFDDAGNYDGMRYYTIPPDAGKQKIADDVQIRTLVPGKGIHDAPTVGTYTVPKGSKTVAEVAALSQAADEKIAGTQLKQYNDDQKAQQLASRTKAENTQSYAAAAKDKAEATAAAADNGDVNDRAARLVEGDDDVSLLSKRSKDYSAIKNAADAYSMQKYGKPFDVAGAAAKYKAKSGIIKAYAEGKEGDQIQSFNTFLGHADNLSSSVNTLRNTNSPLLNMPLNKLSKMEGNPTVSAILPQIEAVRAEYQNFLNNNRALHEQDIKEGRNMIDENMSPAQMQAAIKAFSGVAVTRVGALNDRYKRVTGKDVPDILSQPAQDSLQHLGLQQHAAQVLRGASSGMVTVQIPGSPPGQIPQAALDKFKKDHPNAMVQ